MGNFNRDGKRSGGGFNRFGGGNKFGGRDGGRPAMFRATCSECGSSCEIPFKPNGSRPVFCSNCFEKQGGGGRTSSFGGDRFERPRFEDKQMHDAVCAKCGNDCQVPFRPMADKPVFCSNCFEKPDRSSRSGGNDSGEVMEQIKRLDAKLDRIIKILVPNTAVEKIKEKIEKPEVKKKEVAKEVVKEKKEKIKAKVATKKVSTKKKK